MASTNVCGGIAAHAAIIEGLRDRPGRTRCENCRATDGQRTAAHYNPAMPRNAETIRQWRILQRLHAARQGASVDDLATEMGVTKRTIWRDVGALQEAGFPLADDKTDGRTRWMLAGTPFKGLGDTGLTLIELCSLYMSRALVDRMTGLPFAAAVGDVFRKLTTALPPRMRDFLDQMPGVIQVKAPAVKRPTERRYSEIVARLLEASLGQRAAAMRYFSASSNREKDYDVHPYHVVHADGGLYLIAFVPEYRQVRTFAAERIRRFVIVERRFDRTEDVSDEAFGHSLGVNRGKPERIVVEFASRVAPYIRERTWHRSQALEDTGDGGVRVTLKVCRDWALSSWILSFGPHARVVSPSSLAQEILEQFDDARDTYAPKLAFDGPPAFMVTHPRLGL